MLLMRALGFRLLLPILTILLTSCALNEPPPARAVVATLYGMARPSPAA